MTHEDAHASPLLHVPESARPVARSSGEVQRIGMEAHALLKRSVSTSKPGEERTHIHVAQMPRKDPQRRHLVRTPKPRRPIPTRRREIDPLWPPLDVPNRFPMPSVHHEVRVSLEGPKSDGRVLRSGEEVSRRSRGAGNGVEGEGVDGSRVADELARGWGNFLANALEAGGWERGSVSWNGRERRNAPSVTSSESKSFRKPGSFPPVRFHKRM